MSQLDRPSLDNKRTAQQLSDDVKAQDAKDNNRFFHSTYAIENFINVVQSSKDTDTFKVLTDPTYTGFKLFFHFGASTGLLADESENNQNTALSYLKRIGQTKRYELLKRFINVLSSVNSYCPWMFQEITGLQEAYSQAFADVYLKNQIVINCLETVDNKIGSLNQMYKAIVYDEDNKKYIVPVNLRRFSMSVYVYDFRMFNELDESLAQILQTIDNTDITKINHTMFDLGYCEFAKTSGSSFFDTISNNRSEMNVNDLTIDFEQMATSSLFNSLLGSTALNQGAMNIAVTSSTGNLGNAVNDFLPKRGLDKILSQVGADLIKSKVDALLDVDAWRTRLDRLKANTEAEIVNLAKAQVAKLYLGNVHGFGLDDLLNIQNQSLAAIKNNTFDIPSLKSPDKHGIDLGNVND